MKQHLPTQRGTPGVSVVMAFLNGEPFIAEAIASVLKQSWYDLELILVDDGSTDTSRSTAMECASVDSRVRIIAHPGGMNLGLSASRNAGIAVARAPRIAFIDADDRWPPTKIASQQEIMDRHPEVSLLAGSARYWHSWAGGMDYVRLIGTARDRTIDPPEALLSTYPLGWAEAPGTSGFLVRAEAIARVGGFEERFTGMYEDQAFLVKIYLQEPVFFSSQCWFDYRQHNNSMLAKSLRLGRYLDTREDFLNWFESYLILRSPHVHPRIRRRVQLARARIRLSRLRQGLLTLMQRKRRDHLDLA